MLVANMDYESDLNVTEQTQLHGLFDESLFALAQCDTSSSFRVNFFVRFNFSLAHKFNV